MKTGTKVFAAAVMVIGAAMSFAESHRQQPTHTLADNEAWFLNRIAAWQNGGSHPEVCEAARELQASYLAAGRTADADALSKIGCP